MSATQPGDQPVTAPQPDEDRPVDTIDVLKAIPRMLWDLIHPLLDLDDTSSRFDLSTVDPELRSAWLEALGLPPDTPTDTPPKEVDRNTIERIEGGLEQEQGSLEQHAELLADLITVVRAVDTTIELARTDGPLEEVAADLALTVLLELLAIHWVRRLRGVPGKIVYWLQLAHEAGLFTLLDELSSAEISTSPDLEDRTGTLLDQVYRISMGVKYALDQWDDAPPEPPQPGLPDEEAVHYASRAFLLSLATSWGVATKVKSSWFDYLRAHYGWATELDPWAPGFHPIQSLDGRLADLLASRLLTLHIPSSPGDDAFVADLPAELAARAKLPTAPLAPDPVSTEATVTVALVPEAHHPEARRGLLLLVGGEIERTERLDQDWSLHIELRGPSTIVDVLAPDLDLSAAGLAARLAVTREAGAQSTDMRLLPGARLQLGASSAVVELQEQGPSLRVVAERAVFVLGGEEAEAGLLQTLLRQRELRLELDLGLQLDADGLSLVGGSGLRVELDTLVDTSVLSVRQVALSVEQPEQGGLQLRLAMAVRASLLGLSVSLDRVGLIAQLSPPDDDTSPLPMDPEVFRFLAPSGVGIEVGRGPVQGKLHALYDETTNSYAGVGSFTLPRGLSLDLLGIVTRPGSIGSAHTFLLLGSARLPVAPSVVGWRLTRVGAIIANNRTFDVDAARAGLARGALGALFFTGRTADDAARTLSDLAALFPPADSTVVGLSAQLAWGPGGAITADVAALLELGSVDRLVIAGVLRGRLPQPSAPVVKLNANVLGVLDTPNKELRVDIALFDSKLFRTSIKGAGLFGLWWADEAEGDAAVLSVGGFHPDYERPPQLEGNLQRITVSLADSQLLKVSAEAYVALTTGSVQFGGSVDAFVGIPKYGVRANLTVNALFGWSPCQLRADFSASAGLEVGGVTVLSGRVEGRVSGPDPCWTYEGSVEVTLLWWSWCMDFNEKDDSNSAALPDAEGVDVRALLFERLAHPTSWSDAATERSGLVLRASSDRVVFSPLATPEVRQADVPLGVQLDHFDNRPITGPRRLDITAATVVGGADVSAAIEPVTASFAPATLFDLTTAERLSRSGFEGMQGGVRLEVGGISGGAPVATPMDHEVIGLGPIAEAAVAAASRLPHPTRVDTHLLALATDLQAAFAPEPADVEPITVLERR